MCVPDSQDASDATPISEETLPSTPLPRRQQVILNGSIYVFYVLTAAAFASTVVHFCLLRSTPLEITLRILTIIVAPLCFFWAKSMTSLLCRVIGCAILAIVLSVAYESWLHSPSFPRALLDKRAQEWMLEVDKQVEEARRKAASPSTPESIHQ